MRWVALRSSAPLFAAALIPVVVPTGLACSTCLRENVQDGVLYAEGRTVSGSYESTPADGTWLHYPAGRRYRLKHALGVAGRCVDVLAYLSFSATPLPAGKQGDTTLGTGSTVVVEQIGDDSITIHNDSCSDFYLRVVASARPNCDETGAAGAAGIAGHGG